uniref:hypothetical protein n=1 Tax=Pantanalinema rosaneae TaxID=1620701 RepID=UPI003D6DFB6E
ALEDKSPEIGRDAVLALISSAVSDAASASATRPASAFETRRERRLAHMHSPRRRSGPSPGAAFPGTPRSPDRARISRAKASGALRMAGPG